MTPVGRLKANITRQKLTLTLYLVPKKIEERIGEGIKNDKKNPHVNIHKKAKNRKSGTQIKKQSTQFRTMCK